MTSTFFTLPLFREHFYFNGQGSSPFFPVRINLNLSELIHRNGEVNPRLWSLLVSLSVPSLCFVGYKLWNWVKQVSEEKEIKYEYKYQEELDLLLESKMNEIEEPSTANEDKVKIGNDFYPMRIFRAFKRNYRKKLLRRANNNIKFLVHREVVPAEEFDWKNSFVEDETPRGFVCMRYEPDTESFWYYSDSTNVPYRFLETVARKYVCDYNRLDVFVDIREELKKSVEEVKKRKEIEKNEENENKEDNGQTRIYAKFKKYNHKNARATGVGKKIQIMIAHANRYSYRGTMKDFLFEKEKEKEKEEQKDNNVQENLSYAEWIKSQAELK